MSISIHVYEALVEENVRLKSLLWELRRVAPDPYTPENFPELPHKGSCGPESGCDYTCMEAANMADYNAVLRRVDEFMGR